MAAGSCGPRRWGCRMPGWAIIGTGMVSVQFAQGLRRLGAAGRIVTVASRDAGKARAFAARFGGEALDYAAAMAHPGVEAVHIATPPDLHEAHALMAIAAGKAVLIEKPMAPDAAGAARIAAAARAARVFCMEAMWTRFMPMIAEARARISAGDLGEVRALHGSFMLSDRPDSGASLFDPARGGGALAYRGIYPLSLAWLLLGPADLVSASARIGETGVDEDCTLVLRHHGGALSTLSASLRAPGPNRLTICGTHGMLELSGPIWRPFRARLVRVQPRRGGTGGGARTGLGAALRGSMLVHGLRQRLPAGLLVGGRVLRRPYAGNGYHYEAAEVALRLERGEVESPLMPLDDSIAILRLADAARAAFGERGTGQ